VAASFVVYGDDMTGLFAQSPAAEHRNDDGHLRMWEPKPGVVLSSVTGRFSVDLAVPFMDFFEARVKRRGDRGVHGLHDWTAMTGFDPSIPPRLTAFTLRILHQTRRVVIATHSPMIAMAVRAGNITLRRIELVESTQALEEATRRVLLEV
jgi:hypothetical protein